ncbi:MAG: hypothetical protein ACOZNI_27595 [Myxococcota bacterium]
MILLLACAPEGPWTADRAIAPALARMDTDGDGGVVAAEWATVDDAGLSFGDADGDGDGVLDRDELLALTRRVDPMAWYESDGGAGPEPPRGSPKAGPPPRFDEPPEVRNRVRTNLLVLAVLAEEIASVDPTLPLPSPERAEAAARAGLASPEARTVLDELEAASAKAGLAFPTSLKAAR